MSVCAPQATQNGRVGSNGYWLRMSYGQVSASSALVFSRYLEAIRFLGAVRGAVQAVRWRSLPKVLCRLLWLR